MSEIVEYDKGPVSINLFAHTGVHDLRLYISNDKLKQMGYTPLESFKMESSGEYELDEYFVFMDSKKVSDGVVCSIAIDTDKSDVREEFNVAAPFTPNPQGVNKAPKLFTVNIAAPGDPVKSAMVLDLGNTRSYALLLDDLYPNEPASALPLVELQLQPYGSTDMNPKSGGVFDSYAVLNHPDRFFGKGGEKLSFVRLGEEAGHLRRDLAGDVSLSGRFALSSPKRYFWQDDEEPGGWKCSRRLKLDDKVQVVPLGGLLANLWRTNGCSAKTIPRSRMLMAMIIELLEQAERQLNGWQFQSDQNVRRRRVVEYINVLYPASWSKKVIKCYVKCIEAALATFNERRLHATGVEVKLISNCDEASAALLAYVYGECEKYGGMGDDWITCVGRRCTALPESPPVARIAVIDIGGGTSDLLIGQVQDYASGYGIKLSIDRIYRDGYNRAGDALIREITQRLLAPVLGEALIPANEPLRREMLRHVFCLGDDRELVYKRTSWARGFWFPLVVKLLTSDAPYELDLTNNHAVLQEIYDLVMKWARGHAVKNASDFIESIDTIKSLKIDKQRLRQAVDGAVGDIFSGMARSFGLAVMAFDCDRVVFAGKTSEIPAVRTLFEKNLFLPRDKILSMADYNAGHWCARVAKDGRVRDAKIATVLGAALYTATTINPALLGTNLAVETREVGAMQASRHYYGLISVLNQCFRNDHALFTRDKDECTVSLTGNLMLARRGTENEEQDAELEADIRIIPANIRTHGRLEGDAIVTLRKKILPDDGETVEFQVVSATGRFKDGTPVGTKDIEIRSRLFVSEDFWLDSGCLDI